MVILSMVILIVSCRTSHDNRVEDEVISLVNPVLVNINFLGVEWENNSNQNIELPIYKSGLSVSSNHSVAKTEKTSQVSEKDLPNGTKYKILAYKKTGECWNCYSFHKEEDFVVGQRNPSMILNNGQNYTLLIISMEDKNLPTISDRDSLDRVNIKFNTEKENYTKLSYQRIDNFIPNGKIENKIDIKLKKKHVGLKVILNASDLLGGNMGRKITSVTNAKINYKVPSSVEFGMKNSDLQLSLKEGEKRSLSVSFISVNKDVVESNIIEEFILGDRDIIFSADIKVEGFSNKKSIKIPLKHDKYANKHEFNVKMSECGAYLGSNKTNWIKFMCCDLGSNCIDNVESPSIVWKKSPGNSYAWGRNKIVYNPTGNDYDNTTLSWRASENPCPSGYRIPTSQEWNNVLDVKNNSRERINDKDGRFIGYKIGDALALFWYGDDYRSWIWTATAFSSAERGAYSIKISNSNIETNYKDVKGDGETVRCMKN